LQLDRDGIIGGISASHGKKIVKCINVIEPLVRKLDDQIKTKSVRVSLHLPNFVDIIGLSFSEIELCITELIRAKRFKPKNFGNTKIAGIES